MVSHSRGQLFLQSPLLEYTRFGVFCHRNLVYVTPHVCVTTVLTQAVVREWSVVCYLDEAVFQWTLNTSKRKCWKGYFFYVAFSFQQLKRGNWFTGHLATQSMWSDAGTIFCSSNSVFPLSVLFHQCSMPMCNQKTSDA